MSRQFLRSYAIAFACASLLTGCSRRGDNKAESNRSAVRAAIEQEIDRSLDATRRQDIQTFMAGFAPDFEIAATDGDQGTLADLRNHTLQAWAIIPATRDLRMRIDSVGVISGDTAVVWTFQRWDRLMLQRDGVTRDTVVTTQKHRELWRHTPEGWKRARVTELGGTVMVNGKPFDQ